MKPEPLVITVLLGIAISCVLAIGYGLHKLLTRTKKRKGPPPSLLD